MTQPTVITFDVYGTLACWDEVVCDLMQTLLARSGRSDADIQLAADAFDAESRRLQSVGAFRSYRSILTDSLRPALATAGLSVSPGDETTMLDRLGRVPPFPEVPSVLATLARTARLSPISNTDDALLAGTLEGLGPVFAATVTAEQARAYKPNPGLFRFALGKLAVQPAEHLHVAQGPFSDLAVCSALGLRTVWVNRKGMALQEGLEPIAVIDDLSGLADVVASL